MKIQIDFYSLIMLFQALRLSMDGDDYEPMIGKLGRSIDRYLLRLIYTESYMASFVLENYNIYGDTVDVPLIREGHGFRSED
jgi:hypothetical protein